MNSKYIFVYMSECVCSRIVELKGIFFTLVYIALQRSQNSFDNVFPYIFQMSYIPKCFSVWSSLV